MTGTHYNEDVDRNLGPAEDTNGDTFLTPPNSSAGSVPDTVVTDSSGVANFDLVYLKQYAGWIETEIKASTRVLGSETASTLTFILPWEEGEEQRIPSSPFGYTGP